MEKLGEFLKNIIRLDEFEVYKYWPDVVGARIYEKTEVLRLEGRNLIVGVSDTIWMQQLLMMRTQILRKLNKKLKKQKVDRITFIVKPEIIKTKKQSKLNLKENYDITKIELTKQEKTKALELSKNISDLKLRKSFERFIESTLRIQKIIGEEK